MSQEKLITTTDTTKPTTEHYDARPSTVFYEAWYSAIKMLDKTNQLKAVKYILDYSFYGIEPSDTTTTPAKMIFVMAKPSIDSAQFKYDTAKMNGQKGGRPKEIDDEKAKIILEMRKNGMTQKQVADELSVSTRTIQRLEAAIRQNHNVNVNVNDNDNDNVNDNIGVSDRHSNKEVGAKAPTTTQATQTTTALSYDDKIKVMEMFAEYKSPKDIAKETGFNMKQVNTAIDEYRKNGDKIPKNPDNVVVFPATDGIPYKLDLDDATIDSSPEGLQELYETLIDPFGNAKCESKFVAKWMKEKYNYNAM